MTCETPIGRYDTLIREYRVAEEAVVSYVPASREPIHTDEPRGNGNMGAYMKWS